MDALIIAEIKEKLKEIETRHHVRVLYACESGSRAWGFPSTDSDYDVRFIYAFTANEYLGIDDIKDTIDIPVNEVLDINGWDLRKALRLFSRSNAAVYEWLQSPIVYTQYGDFLPELTAMMGAYFSPRDGMHHYLGVARNAFHTLSGEEIKLKKYFYCLRSLLAAMWIADKQQVPPIEFAILRTQITDVNWQNEIDSLLQLKAGSNESTLIKPHQLLNDFITSNIAVYEAQGNLMPKKEVNNASLHKLFRELIHAV